MKIGILGTAFSFHQAPFNDPSWQLWACNLGEPPRWDRWFQLHSDAVIDGNAGHREWLAAQTKPVYLQRPDATIPNATRYPLETMTAKYGTWFFTSTIAFMLAMALEEADVTEIGLWGVDMADQTEYGAQKNGVRFFLQVARMRGIKLVLPPECEVMVPGRIYGYDELTWLEMKSKARHGELLVRQQEVEGRKQRLVLEKAALMGKRDITLTPVQIETRMGQVNVELEQSERDGLVMEGAIQNMAHILGNWTGASHG